MPLPEVTGRLCIILHVAGLPQTSSLLSYIRSINILPLELRRHERKHIFFLIIIFIFCYNPKTCAISGSGCNAPLAGRDPGRTLGCAQESSSIYR